LSFMWSIRRHPVRPRRRPGAAVVRGRMRRRPPPARRGLVAEAADGARGSPVQILAAAAAATAAGDQGAASTLRARAEAVAARRPITATPGRRWGRRCSTASCRYRLRGARRIP